MLPVRVKVYGLVSMTKPTYLRVQGIGLILLLGVMTAGGFVIGLKGTWRPTFPPKDVDSALILTFWVSLATVLLEMVEMSVVLRKFAQAELRQPAEVAAAPVVVKQTAVQVHTGAQPTQPLDNHPPS